MMHSTRWQRFQQRRQAEWKRTTPDLPEEARRPGQWFGHDAAYILPAEHAAENLWAPIRPAAVRHFAEQDIAWHQEAARGYGERAERGPSPHLLSSQVACVNFWWGLSVAPAALAAALRSVFPDVRRVVAPVAGGPLVEPEWIGRKNYLGEREPRRRGDRTTSADALLAYEDEEGRRHGVLVESKFTESYSLAGPVGGEAGAQKRAAHYRAAFEADGSPLRTDACPPLEALIVEPFYQHLRQQLLAAAMERAEELGFRTVTILHASPRANDSFHETVTVGALAGRGRTVAEVWRSLLRRPDRYRCAAYEDLFAAAVAAGDPAAVGWVEYQRRRYGWGEPFPPQRRGYEGGVFARGLGDELLRELRDGVARPVVAASVANGLDLRLREGYVNVYDAGRSLARIARRRDGAVTLTIHRKYLFRTELPASGGVLRGDYVEFLLDAALAAAWMAALPALRRRAEGCRGKEEEVEEAFLRANHPGSPLVVIDRQVQIPGVQRRLDVAAVAETDDGGHAFVAVELKQGLDNRIQQVPLQTLEYVTMLDPQGSGLRADVARAYRVVADQLRALGFPAPAPESVEPGMPVVGLIVLVNYDGRSRLLGRAAARAEDVGGRLFLWNAPSATALHVPAVREWTLAAAAADEA